MSKESNAFYNILRATALVSAVTAGVSVRACQIQHPTAVEISKLMFPRPVIEKEPAQVKEEPPLVFGNREL